MKYSVHTSVRRSTQGIVRVVQWISSLTFCIGVLEKGTFASNQCFYVAIVLHVVHMCLYSGIYVVGVPSRDILYGSWPVHDHGSAAGLCSVLCYTVLYVRPMSNGMSISCQKALSSCTHVGISSIHFNVLALAVGESPASCFLLGS